eukprot:6212686-Pleurochrysis_carterae.AAC.2
MPKGRWWVGRTSRCTDRADVLRTSLGKITSASRLATPTKWPTASARFLIRPRSSSFASI